MKKWISIATGMCLSVVFLAACGTGQDAESSDTGTEIVIGNITSKTGQYSIGQPGDVGLQIAVDEINEAGGITVDGTTYTFRIEQIDDRSDPAATASAGRDLIANGARFIFGPVGGGSLGVLQQTAPAEVVYVSPSSAAAAELEKSDETFFLSAIPSVTDRMSAVTESFLEFVPDAKKLVVLGADDQVVESIVTGFEATWPEASGGTIETVLYPPGTSDLSSYLAKVRSLDADVLYIGQNEPSVKLALQQLDAAGISQDLPVGGHGVQPHLASEAGGRPFLAAPFMPGPFEGEGTNEATAQLVQSYFDLTGESQLPAYSAPLLWYYDHLHLLALAMEEAGTVTDTAAILDVLKADDIEYDGANGDVSFNAKGYIVHPLLNTFVDQDGATTEYLWTP